MKWRTRATFGNLFALHRRFAMAAQLLFIQCRNVMRRRPISGDSRSIKLRRGVTSIGHEFIVGVMSASVLPGTRNAIAKLALAWRWIHPLQHGFSARSEVGCAPMVDAADHAGPATACAPTKSDPLPRRRFGARLRLLLATAPMQPLMAIAASVAQLQRAA